jgi:probable rRNA maturation factor
MRLPVKDKISISLSGFDLIKAKRATLLKKRIKKVMKALALENQLLSVHLCEDAEIRALNRRFRKKNKATDVLSFEANSDETLGIPVLGDIVISVETAQKQAVQFEHDLGDELCVLFVHGLLHLLGYDHEKSEEEAVKQAEAEMFVLSGIDVPVERALVAR